ncbi:hypothetical protein EZV62_004875 [Acer yangbiense]|uniref:Retrotransposon gag domain-containing protein n=1 Tax=Acer yangbiense TaxID=1000413 RepID=A0A5C7ILB0_9ROSI|nr:hypothetical protein EZV62_004875 [Acer yangbiense]
MYSDLGNQSQIYELQLKLGESKQGSDTVTKYFAGLKRLWQDLDMYGEYTWKDPVDGAHYQKIYNTKQGSMSVTDYYNTLRGLLTELDLYQNVELKSSEDAKTIKDLMEREHVIQFLLGLKSEYDQARDRVLGRDPLPDLDEAFVIIRGEESNKELMSTKIVEVGEATVENSALAVTKSTDNKKSQDKDKLWCDYCNRGIHGLVLEAT